MSSETTENLYFEWLYGLVGAVRNRNPARTSWKMAHKLHSTEFVWLRSNDDNRVEDGKALRLEFLESEGLSPDDVDQDWLTLGCSMLEMLIALARHASFEDLRERGHGEWFGIILHNLEIDDLTDSKYTAEQDRRLEEIMDRVIYRNYNPDGRGGLFPLRNPQEDQRRVELWYQMSAFLLEDMPI